MIDGELLAEACEFTGIEEKTALVNAGLKCLVAVEAGRRLAALGGSEPNIIQIPRRRPKLKMVRQG